MAKRDVIVKQVRLRIRILAAQSYALLVLMAGLIFYGFFISGRALETTNADLQDIRKTAERVRITAELERLKFRLLDIGIQFDKQFSHAQSELDKVVLSITNPGSEKSSGGYNQYATTYFFRTDYGYSARQLESADAANVVSFNTPVECLKVAQLELKRPRDQYFWFAGTDFIYDYGQYARKLSAVVLSTMGDADNRERLRGSLKSGIENALPSLCKNLNTSNEYQQALKSVAQIDLLLDQQDAVSGINQDAKEGSASKVQDAGALALLLANRFGPLIIIFFFSSLIITLYKYNSRLVGFYYARLYALEASGLPIYDGDFANAVKVFSPDGVDFGRVPRTPVDIAGDIAARVVEKIDILKEEKAKTEKNNAGA
ncbi:hypothetical protein [Bradyrhizobium sp. URHC0002]